MVRFTSASVSLFLLLAVTTITDAFMPSQQQTTGNGRLNVENNFLQKSSLTFKDKNNNNNDNNNRGKQHSTQLYSTTKSPPVIPPPKDISYGEESRKYRRTVYSHDDWVKHRSPDRFIRNIVSTTSSGVYKNVGREVMAVTSVATFCMLWNMLFGETYTDLEGIKHTAMFSDSFLPTLSLPLTPFTLASSSLGLLLVFRTNTAYQRWDEARKNWGMNINHTRDLVRMGNAYYDRTGVPDEVRKADLERLSRCTWAFVRAMKRHLSPADDEEDFAKELRERLPQSQAEAILKALHRPNRALYDLSMAIENLPMHFMRKNEMHKALTIFEDNLGSSERLLTSPVPLFYSRHTARFLAFWLLFIPFALYEPFAGTWNHVGMIPASAILSVFLFGIEELATQMEEPFTILPMQAFCDKIGNWCNEIVSWEDGDNGITTRAPYQGHSSVYFENLAASNDSILDEMEKVAPTPSPNGELVSTTGEVLFPNGSSTPPNRRESFKQRLRSIF